MNPVRTVIGVFTVLLMCGSAGAQGTRDVSYSDRSIVRVNAKLRFTTLIVLPEHEQILDFVCGDKDFWIISGVENMAYVKPAKLGASTNLNLVTASGTVYSFLLMEGAEEPDLKLYVVPEGSTASVGGTGRKFYVAAEVESLRRDAALAREEATAARAASTKAAEEAITKFRAGYPTTLRFPYRFDANKKPFLVSAIYHDGQFTYIRADATELPSLYEVRDKAPNLVNFQVENGVYIVPKVIERGYLAIGKKRLGFEQAAAR